jgi:hypothetical protein
MRGPLLPAAALLAALLFAPASQAQMYKCVDKKGVTHYTDSPPPGCKGGEVDIRPIPPISGGAGETPRREEDFAQQEAEFKRRQNERAGVESQERAQLAERCKMLRQEHAVLSSGRPLARLNDQGERIYVPDEIREQRLNRLRDALRACP